jgi:hypothetical protein
MDGNADVPGTAVKRYRVLVRGTLSERFAPAFDGVTLEAASGMTALVGDVRDQAQLYGILDRVRDFGLELVSVEEVPRS